MKLKQEMACYLYFKKSIRISIHDSSKTGNKKVHHCFGFFFFFAQYQGGRIKLLRIFREMNSKTVSPKVWV